MSGTIKIDPAEYAIAVATCRSQSESLLSTSASLGLPAGSSRSPAIDAFLLRVTDLGMVISAYKAVLQSDVAALAEAEQGFLEADRAAAEAMRR